MSEQLRLAFECGVCRSKSWYRVRRGEVGLRFNAWVDVEDGGGAERRPGWAN